MSKHTAQEWQRTGMTVYALNIEGTNRFSAQVQGGWATDGRLRTDAAELEANACLIAAAPELLGALKLCAGVCSGETLNKSSLVAALNKAHAAIAKATGGQP